MGTFPGSPRTLRGAILAVTRANPIARAVIFQYNPDSVTRSVRPRSAPQETPAAPEDAHRIWGAPVETVTMTVEVDAADQLETGDPLTVATGISGQLAALEMLLYPGSPLVIANTLLLQAGTIAVMPPESPLVLLVWGPARVVPIRLESLSITEQAFGTTLHPVRASVEISAQVLSYNDLPASDPGYALFLVHQVLKEALATAAVVNGAVSALTSPAGA
ncbi:hypothetical protein ABZ615_17860 [Streptomyces sp. NPDC007325]|uniref:hypothetical protein n=1 Tax=Streptomyces sp. NPDC007325 TaxID=3154588 RepID=UPI00340BA382